MLQYQGFLFQLVGSLRYVWMVKHPAAAVYLNMDVSPGLVFRSLFVQMIAILSGISYPIHDGEKDFLSRYNLQCHNPIQVRWHEFVPCQQYGAAATPPSGDPGPMTVMGQ